MSPMKWVISYDVIHFKVNDNESTAGKIRTSLRRYFMLRKGWKCQNSKMPEFVIKTAFIRFQTFDQKSHVQIIEWFEANNFRRRMFISSRFSSSVWITAIYQWRARRGGAFYWADCRLLAFNRVANFCINYQKIGNPVGSEISNFC